MLRYCLYFIICINALTFFIVAGIFITKNVGHVEGLKLLLLFGANANDKDDNGHTSMSKATREGKMIHLSSFYFARTHYIPLSLHAISCI